MWRELKKYSEITKRKQFNLFPLELETVVRQPAVLIKTPICDP